MANSRKYKFITVHGKKYPEVEIHWMDILGDSSIATAEEFGKMKPANLISKCYLYKRTKDYIYTFATYQVDNDESYGDRNVFPVGIVKKVLRITL